MPSFKKTIRQKQAIKMLASEQSRYCMLYGGSRSGKTFIALYALIVRACKVQSRHAVLRLKFNHAKTSIWMDTLPKVLSICFPHLDVKFNKSDYYLSFPNGSELWVGGLDDGARVEKILGKEYSTIYFNESSQISYRLVEIALTRLAEANYLKKKAYFDMNPPTKKHWSYWVFMKHVHPDDSRALKKEKYCSILMNPKDNLENIDSEYITEILDPMSDNERRRFRDGEFVDSDEGSVYYSFQRDINVHEMDKRIRSGSLMIGMDFNVDPMTATVGYYVNNTFWVIDEVFLRNSDTYEMADELIKRGYRGGVIFPDSTGRNRKTSGRSDHYILKEAGFTVNFVANPRERDRINNVNRLLRDGRIIVDPKCKNLINDLEKVVYNGSEIDKRSDPLLSHVSDALGYWTWNIEPIRNKIETKAYSQKR